MHFWWDDFGRNGNYLPNESHANCAALLRVRWLMFIAYVFISREIGQYLFVRFVFAGRFVGSLSRREGIGHGGNF